MTVIRSADVEDAGRLLEIYAWYIENTAITFECDVPTDAEFRGRISRTLEHYPWLVLEQDGLIQGYAYAGPFNPRKAYARSCDLSIYLDRGSRKQGFGRMLYEALERSLRQRGMLNLYALIAWPRVEDEYLTRNSVQFHEHLGFHTAGHFTNCACKFNRWYDMITMEKFLGEHVSGAH